MMLGPVDLYAFVERHLPPPPARVLEVGCGRGELARTIARGGHHVVAIDPNAPTGDLFAPVTLEAFSDPEPFDAVIANRSLHHIADLPGALDKIASLLRPGGRLILSEHACDRLDTATAHWYLQHRAKTDLNAPGSVDACLAAWQVDHADLHGYEAMHHELGRRFAERVLEWTPYLYGELAGAVTEHDERAVIESGEIRAMGFRYVGERTTGE
jgi:SAM-dependent methyltransferase